MLTYVEPRGDHSNILKLGTLQNKGGALWNLVPSREPQQHFEIMDSKLLILARTCDKNEGRWREAKPGDPDELVRFTARTPCCKQLFGEQSDSQSAAFC